MTLRGTRRWSCHLVVAAWGAALLARAPAAPQEREPAPLQVALRPVTLAATSRPPESAVSKPEPEPAPTPKPEPAPHAAAPPTPSEPPARSVGAAELESGGALLDAGGAFPALSFGYESFVSFREYARAMHALGARFVVVRSREILGGLDLESGATAAFPGGAFSPRARDYGGEPGLAAVERDVRERFGAGASVMMLVPRRLDAGLFGGLARLLVERGLPHAELREIRGRYERGPAGGVRLRLEAAVRRDGSQVPVEALFDLGQLAGAA